LIGYRFDDTTSTLSSSGHSPYFPTEILKSLLQDSHQNNDCDYDRENCDDCNDNCENSWIPGDDAAQGPLGVEVADLVSRGRETVLPDGHQQDKLMSMIAETPGSGS